MIKNREERKNTILFLVTWFFGSLFMLGSHVPMGAVLLLVGMIMQYACSVYITGHVIKTKINPVYIILTLFIVWCFATLVWSEDRLLTLSKSMDVAEMIIMSLFIFICFEHERSIKVLLHVIMWACFSVVVYVYAVYGLHGIMNFAEEGHRIDNEAMNANGIGLCAAYTGIIAFYFFLYYGPRIWQLNIVPALIVLAVSSSRKGIVLFLGGCLGIIILRQFQKGISIKKVFQFIFILAAFLVVIYFVLRLPMFSKLNERMMSLIDPTKNGGIAHDSAWHREQYRALGIRLFLKHPIGGIGLDVARVYVGHAFGEPKYTHNNYIELLADTGFVGAVLFYSVYVYLLVQFWKHRKYADSEYNICVVLLLMNLLMDYGMVSYETKRTYLFLVLFEVELLILKKSKNKKEFVYAYMEKSG